MPKIEPTPAEVIREAITSRLADVHTSLPGRVVKYDSAAGTVDVAPVVRGALPMDDGSAELEDLPVIPNVPIGWPRGGGFFIRFPLVPGDHVWLVFSEASIALWRTTGETSEPGDLRRHDLSYPIALPCVAPDAETLPAGGADELVIDGPGTVRIGSEAAAKFVAIAELVSARLDAIQSAFDAHDHVVAGTAPGFPATAAPPLSPIGPLAPVAATKLKAE